MREVANELPAFSLRYAREKNNKILVVEFSTQAKSTCPNLYVVLFFRPVACNGLLLLLKLRPCENSLTDFCTSILLKA